MLNRIERVRAEWASIRAAPGAFTIAVLVAAILIFIALRWAYEARLDTVREQKHTLERQLELKEERIKDYIERLRLAPRTENRYSTATNEELVEAAMELALGIRQLKLEFEMATDPTGQLPNAATEKQRREAWKRQSENWSTEFNILRARYDAEFKVSTILLREELVRRVPPDIVFGMSPDFFAHPTNAIGMGMAADELERLARLLP